MERCNWTQNNPRLTAYHDEEWGVPVWNDNTMFEFIVLESFQAGLSWLTILKKRKRFREVFDDFHVDSVASYDEEKMVELMRDPGIIRNRRKIEAAVNNARCFIDIRDEYGSFCQYLWNFVDGKPLQNSYDHWEDIPAKTELSDIISRELKRRGFRFFGSTICYAHMQATGMVNDHENSCFRYEPVRELGQRFAHTRHQDGF